MLLYVSSAAAILYNFKGKHLNMRKQNIKSLVALSALLIGLNLPAFADTDPQVEPAIEASTSDAAPQEATDEGHKSHGKNRPPGMARKQSFASRLLRLKDKLTLSADQVAALEQLNADTAKNIADANAEFKSAQAEMKKLEPALDTVDVSTFRAAVDRLVAGKSGIFKALTAS